MSWPRGLRGGGNHYARAVKRRLLPIVSLACLAASALVLSACGGSTSDSGSTRAAAPLSVVPDTKTCPERSPSFTFNGTIVNRLKVPVTLQVGEYTCDDWSGASTPGAVMTGRTIESGRWIDVTLEPRTYRNRMWTMEFVAADGSTSFGDARIALPTSTIEPFWTANGAGSYERTWKFQGDDITATFLPIGPTGQADTPTSLLPAASTDMGIVAYRKQVALVTQARVSG